MNNKVAAFTLSEMIVVIIITSIVAGIAFSVLTLVQRHMYAIQANFNSQMELNKLEQSLWLDFHKYPIISFDAKQQKLSLLNELDSTHYTFNKKSIIKELDTFKIEISVKTLFFNGDSINKGLVDALMLTVSKKNLDKQLFVFKKNDATLYMN
ncbi:prepilin-type N-terminal cleavage/methylation domain-containing protein [Pontimicrobium aquaticum]|uniref:Prepilin-type N-terminal cleavage/methylation domain-containing protein n=1 Tax=Pontimicrobium aquaticum TaxID=2565367 RepID=A0A4U0F0Y1_9FLAO|nr:prepilin-type N-terminal cleavage/methylation domain-containing protein [Pontimicrobium aquaticum]TJY37394.1 hypothetical protein E5167_05480 [Pontimicrobium aquaticum]